MTADKFEKNNWAAFEKRYGAIIPEDVRASQQENIEIVSSRNGLPTVRVTKLDGKKIFLHSSVDPAREANTIAEGLEVSLGNFVVVYGFGLGYLIEALLNKLDEKIPLFVIEPDRALFCVAMSTRDLRSVTSSGRVVIVLQGAGSDLGTSFSECYDITRYTRMVMTGLVGHQKIYNEDYDNTIHQLHDTMRAKIVHLRTLSKIERAMISNAIINLPTYYASPGIKTLFGRFKGMPAIIVSAGPSLNKNIHLLKQVKGKAVILAVGTALKPLQENGIEPDFMVSIDPQLYNYEHFRGVNTNQAALITAIESYPEILEKQDGPMFVSGDSPILEWFGGVIEEKGVMEGGGSVANNAMTAAFKMGANPIIFVGQDLAYAKDGHTHAAGTNYENSIQDLEYLAKANNPEYFLIKANDGGEVLTNILFYQFLKFFEAWIDNHPQPEYINATEGGALIEGTKIMTLQQVLDQYCVKNIDVQGIIKAATELFTMPDFKLLVIRIEKCVTNLNVMVKEAYLAIKRLNQLERACENGQTQKIKHYTKDAERCYEKFEQNIDIAEWFCHDDIQQVLSRIHQAPFKTQNDYHVVIADYKLYYETIINGATKAQSLMEDCITKMLK
jgi:hypothetical protein